MQAKRLIILCVAFMLLCTATVFADSMWGTYNGYEKAKVYVNDSELKEGSVPAIVMNGSTLLPLRQVANSLDAIVKWDNDKKTASIYKPNVHMFIAEEVGKNYSLKNPFSIVDYGITRSFDVFAQIDNLKTSANRVKITIVSPGGETVGTVEDALSGSAESFWYTAHYKIKFAEKGNYAVKFAIIDGDGNESVVSQKSILSE
ncbi:stalk domain-containing protein [Paenibacillus sp. MBLB4367]|uniref:stalk domain-containing protein n=1 Tax=Paenibacillus sp. MBLB4367 TaxID=3384767 RepID=UPI0039081D27